jgi:hypothetical protein
MKATSYTAEETHVAEDQKETLFSSWQLASESSLQYYYLSIGQLSEFEL